MNIHVGNAAGETFGEFALDVETGLVNARCDEVGREGGDVVLR
jgi:hypothetical protein